MAITTTYTGTFTLDMLANAALTGDAAGNYRLPALAKAVTFAAAGGTAPTIAGFMYGIGTFTGVTHILLAHATDPLQGAGDCGYSLGFTVAGSKLKLLYIENTHATITLRVAREATLGLPIFVAGSDAVDLPPGGIFCLHFPAGTAALTTGSNDGLAVTPTDTGCTALFIALYGP